MKRRALLRACSTLAAAFLAAASCSDGPPRKGLLLGPGYNGDWYAVGASGRVGESWSFGTVVWLPPGVKERVVIKSVKPYGVRGLDVVGVALNAPERDFGAVGSEKGFPPAEAGDHPLPIDNAVLAAAPEEARKHGIAITLGVRRSSVGRGYLTGYVIEYSVNGQRRKQLFLTGISVCAFAQQPRPDAKCEAVPDQLRKH